MVKSIVLFAMGSLGSKILVKSYHTIRQWAQWLTKPLGKRVLEIEKSKLTKLLTTSKNNTLLIGVPEQIELVKNDSIPNPIVLGPLIYKNKNMHYIESEFDNLPVLPGSLDFVILPHTLEFVDNPRQLLTEACKTVKPEGLIIIFGFNRFSFWGLKKWWMKEKELPERGHFLRASLIKKWLHLADFELLRQDMIMFRPPMLQNKFYNKLAWLEWLGTKCNLPFGGIFVITAKAKLIPVTPIKLRWNQKLAPLSVTLPGPSMRDMR